MKIFLHPFVVMMVVVFVVTVEEPFVFTLTDSREIDFLNSNTFFGARSRGRRVVFVPASLHTSTITSASSLLLMMLFSSSQLESVLLDVKLDTDEAVRNV